MSTKFNVSSFTVDEAKPLPVVLLLDTSGSMHGDKISALNDAVREMLTTLRKTETQSHEFLVSVITFGGVASLAYPPTSASALAFSNLGADGSTPLGAALDIAKSLIEDREYTPGRAYRPLVVLVSDGEPNDAWETKLDDFIKEGRSAKCDRMALGIGREAYQGIGRATLEKFIAGTNRPVFEAKEATEIHKFFKFVTMSVVTRRLSQDPNVIPPSAGVDPSPTPPLSASTPPPPSTPPPLPPVPEDEDSYW